MLYYPLSLVILIVAGIDCTIGKSDGPGSCVAHKEAVKLFYFSRVADVRISWKKKISTLINETDRHIAFPWGPCFRWDTDQPVMPGQVKDLLTSLLRFCLSTCVLLQHGWPFYLRVCLAHILDLQGLLAACPVTEMHAWPPCFGLPCSAMLNLVPFLESSFLKLFFTRNTRYTPLSSSPAPHPVTWPTHTILPVSSPTSLCSRSSLPCPFHHKSSLGVPAMCYLQDLLFLPDLEVTMLFFFFEFVFV